MRKSILIISLILLIVFLIIDNVKTVYAVNEKTFVPGEIIIKLKSGISSQQGATVFSTDSPDQESLKSLLPELNEYDVSSVKKIFRNDINSNISAQSAGQNRSVSASAGAPDLTRTYKLTVSEDADTESLVKALESNPNVEYAQLNHLVKLCLVPNDPYLNSSGSWGNSFNDMWGIYKIQADKAWDITTGSKEVLVAVIDTGVDYSHEDLGGRVINGRDHSNQDFDSIDEDGHGTHVAGIIAATGNNARGIAGIAWNCKILAIKIFPYGTEADCASAIYDAVKFGADVINMSWCLVGTSSSPVLNDAIEHAVLNEVVLVAAAGNDYSDVANCTPANHRDVIAVAATDKNDERCPFSNIGEEIDVAAPGGGYGTLNGTYNILSLKSGNISDDYDSFVVGYNYLRLGGTSMAAPYVSGLAALILSIEPNFSAGEVKSIITASVDPISETYRLGFGRINAHEAVKLALDRKAEVADRTDEGGSNDTGEEVIDPPEWVKNLKIGDIAVDNDNNIYVVYTNQHKIVKHKLSANSDTAASSVILSTNSFGDSMLHYPMGVAVSPSGDRIIIADTFKNRILVYNKDLSPLYAKTNDVFGGFLQVSTHKENWFGLNKYAYKTQTYPDYAGTFNLPTDVRIQGENVFVVDSGTKRVLKYDLHDDGSLICSTYNVYMSKERLKYIYEKDNSVFKNCFGGTGFLTILGGNPIGGIVIGLIGAIFGEETKVDSIKYRSNAIENDFNEPFSVAVKTSLYVADTGGDHIQMFSADGSFFSKFGEDILNDPKGIDTDSYGNIFVADTGNQRIVQFDALGNFVKEYRSEEYDIDPQKLEVKDGKIYIADANSGRPLVWNIAGEISNVRVSDNGWFSPNGDGQKDNLKISYNLSQPADVTIQVIPKPSDGAVAMEADGGIALEDASRSIGRQEEIWDGSIRVSGSSAQDAESGEENVIADENYSLKIIASFGDYIKTKTADINVDTVKPSLALNRDPPGISPNSDAVKDSLIINYSISDNLSPTSEVKLSLWKNNKIIDVLKDSHYVLPITHSFDWDGKIGDYVIEGNFILELKATDLAGNTMSITTEVLVDAQAPRIEALNLSNKYFSPNGDGQKDDTEIKFNLYDTYANKMYVTAWVLDENNIEIFEISWKKELTAGEHVLTWEGTNDSGELAADGVYRIEIFAEDGAGNLGTSEPATVVVDTLPPDIIDFAADPNPFAPNNDGIKDRTEFSYVFSEPCNAVLRILRDDGSTLFRDHRHYNIINGNFNWDGTGFHGEILGEEHPYYLYAEDRAGNITTSESQIIIVDHTPSLVPYAFADPDPFSAVNPANNFTDINYYLSRDGLSVNVAVIGREGRVVKNLFSNEIQNKGEHSVRWHGDFESSYDGPRIGDKVADGSWEFRVSAIASDGSNPCNTTNTVLVDNVPPYIMVAPVEVDRINKTATLKYSVPETVTIEVAVLDNDDNLISMLEDSSYRSPGDYALTYDFSGDSEQETGNRHFKIVAVDRAKNSAEKITEAFAVNPEVLQVADHRAIPAVFTPNGDGHTDLTRIAYRISGGEPHYKVTIDVVTPIGSTVKWLIENETQAPATYSFYWDGLDESGQLVEDGYYDYVIVAEDELGTRVEGRGTMLVVSTRPTVDLSTGLPVFSPNGDGSKDSVIFNYSVDYPVQFITGEALVKLEVLDVTGEAVWSRIFNHTAGSYAYEYDGMTSGSLRLPAGNYYVRARAEDALGSNAAPKTVSLQVDYEKPMVSIAEISPNPFSPDPNGINDETAIAYTVSKDSDVTIRIKDSTGSIVKELLESERVSASQIRAAAVPTMIWDGRDTSGSIVSDGNYVIFISAIDDAGNTGEALAEVMVDNNTNFSSDLLPIRNVDIKPFYAKEGSKVTIDFSVSEELLAQPVVYVGSYPATMEGSEKLSDTRFDYHYSHVIGDDPEGNTRVYIEITDLAGNVSSTESEVVVDKTAPEINSLSADPNPATVGEMTIGFTVSEPLEEVPEVYVTQNGAAPQLATVSGVWSETDGQVESKYNAVSGYDGPALITVEGVDLAGNTFVYSFNDSLIIDTIVPTFSNIQSEIASNPEFTKYAKEGSEVTVCFKTSEGLRFNPEVKVNENPADYFSLMADEYTYKYTVSGSDTNGNAMISISGSDFAGNEGIAETSSTQESFVIDLIKPTVTIAEDPGMIANPSPFSTNSSSEVGHLQTRLSYEISEPGYVTIGIHKVPNAQQVYTRDDFNDNNLIISFDENWLLQGQHYKYWEGIIQHNQLTYDQNSNGFADPGKYAFIVEVKDRAGNLIEGKWGGTCWIQDNVLKLVNPEQFANNNPDPGYFSPNSDGSLDSIQIYFRVDLGVTPAECATPEKISVLALPDDFKWLSGIVKKIGTYSVRVYNENKTILIRRMVTDADLYSNVVLSETWDGNNDAGEYVPEGNYKIEIDVRDFIGGQAVDNLLTLDVTVDKSAPRVVSYEPDLANTPWRNTSQFYNVDFFDDHNGYASKLNYAQYKITTGPNQSGTTQVDWTDIFSDNLNSSYYTADWGSEIFDSCGQGTYYVSVRVFDNAGNENVVNDVFYVKKDTVVPSNPSLSITNTYNGSEDYTKYRDVNLSVGANDAHSGVSEIWIRNDNGTYQRYTANPWTLGDVDGQRYVYVKFKDMAGNWTQDDVVGDYIILDRQSPYISNLPVVVDGDFNPYTEDSTTINFTAYDQGDSGILSLTAKIKYGSNVVKDLSVISNGNNRSVTWDGTNNNNPSDYENEGDYTLEIIAVDRSGNLATLKTSKIYLRDDQYVVDGRENVCLGINSNQLEIGWVDQERNLSVPISISQSTRLHSFSNESISVYIDHTQTITLNMSGILADGSCTFCSEVWYIIKNSSGSIVYRQHRYSSYDDMSHPHWTGYNDILGDSYHYDPSNNLYSLYDGVGNAGIYNFSDSVTLAPDNYTFYVSVMHASVATSYPGPSEASLQFTYLDKEYYYGDRSYNSDYAKNIAAGIYSSSPMVWINDLPHTGSTVNVGGITHTVSSNNGIYYERNNSGNPVKISNVGTEPRVEADTNGNAYVTWLGNNQIFFQKVPYNFALVMGTAQGASIMSGSQPVISQSITFESPTLIAPEDEANVTTLRPTFKWKHRKGDTQEYKIDLAKDEYFGVAHQTFSKSANTGSQADPNNDPDLYNYTYSIHEFDPGLDRDAYWWKVTAILTNEVATSEPWSFIVAPELTLTGVTNYPNPFNPKHMNPSQRTTNIRYRLGATADSVKIRIYDITGSLVREITNCPIAGELSSVWDKYHDVEWDGRNGRGDVVVNGIYPFEVIARLADKTVSGRGKVAVLK